MAQHWNNVVGHFSRRIIFEHLLKEPAPTSPHLVRQVYRQIKAISAINLLYRAISSVGQATDVGAVERSMIVSWLSLQGYPLEAAKISTGKFAAFQVILPQKQGVISRCGGDIIANPPLSPKLVSG